MTPKSAKAKGRSLQNLVRDKILEANPHLSKNDIRTAIMGENGADIKLSDYARNVFPFSIECKARESFSIYKLWEQAVTDEELIPLLVIKQNRALPLVVVELETFLDLIRK